jgi:hypothetical protein
MVSLSYLLIDVNALLKTFKIFISDIFMSVRTYLTPIAQSSNVESADMSSVSLLTWIEILRDLS